MTGQSIPCTQCGELFVFTDAERAFFDSKGLLPPKRCKSCRAARKSQGRPSRPPGGERQLWDATCTGCGAPATVPFEPQAGRDVFCGRCWHGRRDPPRAGAPTSHDSVDPADTDAEREVGVPAIIE
jgi:CxxC-x17-CxxC domain-containing protein